jgi:transcriptional regulator with XRE-family HTH domain
MLINLVDMPKRTSPPVAREAPEDREATEHYLPYLRAWRNYRKFTQARLAELAGCSQAFIAQLEKGTSDAPLGQVARIARALRITRMQLLFFAPGEDNIYEIVSELSESDLPIAKRLLKSINPPK